MMMTTSSKRSLNRMALTGRQKFVLQTIHEQISSGELVPTLRELGTILGIHSTNGVNDHLRYLEKKGFIRRDRMKSRSIRLTEVGLRECDSSEPGLTRLALLEALYRAIIAHGCGESLPGEVAAILDGLRAVGHVEFDEHALEEEAADEASAAVRGRKG